RGPLGASVFSSGISRPCSSKSFLWLVVAHPRFQHFQVTRVRRDVGQRNLVRSPETFQVVPVHFPWRGPAFGAAEDDHGPARSKGLAGLPRLLLVLPD